MEKDLKNYDTTSISLLNITTLNLKLKIKKKVSLHVQSACDEVSKTIRAFLSAYGKKKI